MIAAADRRLEEIVLVAATAPGYAQRFSDAGMLHPTGGPHLRLAPDWRERFRDVPVLARDELRASPERFTVSLSGVVYRGTTSGTRSTAYIYFAGQEWNAAREQGLSLLRAWWGIPDSVPTLNVASRLLPSRANDASLVGPIDERLVEMFREILSVGPHVIRGYPSRLAALARWLGDVPPGQVVSVIATGEILYPFQEREISEAFGCEVRNEYGCLESGIYGGSCPRCRAVVLDASRCFHEVVDSLLVTTDLLNRHMPMVRYACGDMVDEGDHCGCGGLRILGRREDVIAVGGRRTYPGAFRGCVDTQANISSIAFGERRIVVDAEVPAICQPEAVARELAEECQRFLPTEIVDVRLSVLPTTVEGSAKGIAPVGKRRWMSAVRRGNWSGAELAAYPISGQIATAAKLLSRLSGQRIIIGRYGLHPSVEALVHECASVPLAHPEEEALALRVLLFACAAMLPGAPLLQPTLGTIVRRATSLLAAAPNGATPDWLQALQVDLMTSEILLGDSEAESAAGGVPEEGSPLDRLSVQLVLQCAEHAVCRFRSAGPRLRPMLGVMIADLREFATFYGPWLPAVWRALLGAPTSCAWPCRNEAAVFVVRSRLEGLSGNAFAVREPLPNLRRERLELERAYALLLAGTPLEHREWLARFNRYSSSRGRVIDPAGWMPVLRAIAAPLAELGRKAEGYQALVASSAPTASTALFDTLTRRVNDKLAVLYSLEPGAALEPAH